ncbi:MAG: hypothetical protein HYV14_00575 [Elusimicrobia bacterium]|nr:hypothetical protein [Elusimicrobiota bacterium]
MEPVTPSPGKPSWGSFLARVFVGLALGLLAVDLSWNLLRAWLSGSLELSAEPAMKAAFIFAAAGCAFLTGQQARAAARAWRGDPDPTGAEWAARTFAAVAVVWMGWYFLMCLPYFMRPYTMMKERQAAILARVPEVARLETLDEAGLRALTIALIPAAADPDKSTRAGAREALTRAAARPGAPKDLLIPFFLADLEETKMIPSNAAWGLGELGAEGRAALIATVTGPGDWAPQAAAFQLARMKPPAVDAIPALEEALSKAPEHRRHEFRLALDRIRGKRR